MKSECIGVELSGVCGRVGDVRGMEECGWWEQGRMLFVEKRPLMVETCKSVFIRRGDECIAISGPSPGHGH